MCLIKHIINVCLNNSKMEQRGKKFNYVRTRVSKNADSWKKKIDFVCLCVLREQKKRQIFFFNENTRTVSASDRILILCSRFCMNVKWKKLLAWIRYWVRALSVSFPIFHSFWLKRRKKITNWKSTLKFSRILIRKYMHNEIALMRKS